MFICRTCLRETTFKDSIHIQEDNRSIIIKQQLFMCIPEMVLDIVANPVICSFCVEILNSLSAFKKLCLNTETHIRSYMQKNGITDNCDVIKMHMFNKRLSEHNEPSKKAVQRSKKRILQSDSTTKDTPPAKHNFKRKFTNKSHSFSEKNTPSTDSVLRALLTEPILKVNDAKYTCDVCQYSFKLKCYLIKHMKLHKPPNAFACCNCNFQTAFASVLTKHKDHCTGGKELSCP